MTSTIATSTNKFHRHNGPFGGVAAGLGRTFGVKGGAIRLALVAAAILAGPIVLAIYVGLWYAMPVDPTVPVEDRPDTPPIALVVLLALFFGLGIAFDFIFGVFSLIGSISLVGWLLIGVLVAVFARSRR